MSLINNMLNELEKNKTTDDSARAEILSSINLTTQKHKAAFEKKIIGWALILAVTIGVFLYYRSAITTNTTVTNLINLQKTILAASKKPFAPKPSAPTSDKANKILTSIEPTIKLKNITLQTANDKTIMNFALSSPALYYIEHSADRQQLFITLSNTGLLGNVPVTLDNSFVLALNTKQKGTSIVCTLTLLPGTKVDELQLIDKPQPLLQLILSNEQLTSSKMSKTPIPVSLEQQEEQRYQNILQLMAQNNVKESITQLQLFLGDFTNNLEAREMLVALLIKKGAWQKANNILMVGLNKHPTYAPFMKLKAHILIEQGKTEAAITFLQKISSSFTDDPEYFALLAALYQQQGQFMRAAGYYNQLTKIQPQKATWWVGLGVSLESAGKKNAANEAYNRAYNSLEVPPDLIAFLADKIKK
jgi:hypothetical protein